MKSETTKTATLLWRRKKKNSFNQKYTVNTDSFWSSRSSFTTNFLQPNPVTNQNHYIHIVYIINTSVFCTELLICDSIESVESQTPHSTTCYSPTHYSNGNTKYYNGIMVDNTVLPNAGVSQQQR